MRVVPLVLSAALMSGCAAHHRIIIQAEPDDAQIYVDGERAGVGTAYVDVGQEHGPARTLLVQLRHPDYRSEIVRIENKPDYGRAWGAAALSAGIGVGTGISYAIDAQRGGATQSLNLLMLGVAVGCVLGAPAYFWLSNKFDPAYNVEMGEKKDTPAPRSKR